LFYFIPSPGGRLSEVAKPGHQVFGIFRRTGVIRLIKSILEKQSVEEVFTTFAPAYGGVYEFQIPFEDKPDV